MVYILYVVFTRSLDEVVNTINEAVVRNQCRYFAPTAVPVFYTRTFYCCTVVSARRQETQTRNPSEP